MNMMILGPISENLFSFTFSARVWNSLQMGGPQVLGDIFISINKDNKYKDFSQKIIILPKPWMSVDASLNEQVSSFYAQLYKSMDDPDDDSDQADHIQKKCLITGEPLTDHFVKLDCGHQFNYVPLYHDVANHKKKYNSMERTMLKANEIRCPYCRKHQQRLLPFLPELGLAKQHGINFFDELKQQASTSFLKQTVWVTGKCCFQVALAAGNTIVCSNTQVNKSELDGKTYCYQHKSTAEKLFFAKKKMEIKAHKEAAKKQQKDAALAAKLKEKQAAAEAKKLAKLAAVEAKAKSATEAKKLAAVEAKAKSAAAAEEVTGCAQVLKSGLRKGQCCGAKTCEGGFCKRHSKLATLVNDEK
jgi:hypothetical protein